jgi:shikimate kinase/3-dehydroquinate synthase
MTTTRTIALSGFMATGKSTAGPTLAARLGVPFVDTDDVIAKEAGRPVPELWKVEGEAAFRAREAALVARLLAPGEPARVLALGGGTVTVRATRHLLLDRAVVVTLTASPETIVARVPDVAGRPNLSVGGDPVRRARELLEQRADAYAECHATIDTDETDIDTVVDVAEAVARRDPLAVPLGARTYPIDVAHDAPSLLTDAVARVAPSSVLLVTDANVQRARGHEIAAALAPLALPGVRVALPAGERHKTLASVAMIWDAALGAGVDRDALVVAVGGGVVGDLAGFAAATLLRGVRVVQVPTTLLAMVDASVGGKTGFDHPAGKNLLGAFHQPSAVVADLAHLSTLPRRERIAGLAEVVKIAVATDAALLDRLERDASAVAAGDPGALLPVVREAVRAKVRVVRDDERERGARALLNLGHTVGHALEAHGGYARWLHGEAVAIGTVLEMRAAAALLGAPSAARALADRVAALLERLGLPAAAPAGELAASWPYVTADKKRAGTRIKLPVVTAPGVAHVEPIALDDLRRAALSL